MNISPEFKRFYDSENTITRFCKNVKSGSGKKSPAGHAMRQYPESHARKKRRRSAFSTTVKLLIAIAPAQNAGFNFQLPPAASTTPAASGTPARL
jgi:hypothetical protein